MEEAAFDSGDVSEILIILSYHTINPKREVLRQLAKLWDEWDAKKELKEYILAYTCLWDKDDSSVEILNALKEAARKLLMTMFIKYCEEKLK